jgi:hypothetical protein
MKSVKKITVDTLQEIAKQLPDTPQRLGFGTTEVSKQEYLNYTEKILRSSTHETWAYYQDEKLISFMSSFDFPNLPYYGILNFKVIKNTNYFSQIKSGYIDLFNTITEHKEQQQRYTFFVTRAIQRNTDVRKRLFDEWQKYAPEFFNRYLRTIEEVIPAGSLSKYEYFNRALLRDKVYDNDMLIMKWTCRNEFRKKIMNPEQEHVSSLIDKELRKCDSFDSFN